jgi:hypothetical protein
MDARSSSAMMDDARPLNSGDRIMDNLWRRAWLPALILSFGGVTQTAPALAQDNAAKPAAPAQHSSTKPSGAAMTSAQQDNVSASRSDSGVKEKANDGNRAVTAPAKPGGTTRGVGAAQAASPTAPKTTGATAPRPATTSETSAKAGQKAPVERHSAVKENPKLPSRMPPPQGNPSAPPPNQHPAEPQNP